GGAARVGAARRERGRAECGGERRRGARGSGAECAARRRSAVAPSRRGRTAVRGGGVRDGATRRNAVTGDAVTAHEAVRGDATAFGRSEIAQLHDAFRVFTDATATLEREYQLLRAQAVELRSQPAEKQRALMASLERERELELQALRQSRLAAEREMAATHAHEVRNPLGGMELFTRLLIDELASQPRARRLAEQVARGIQDLNHLVGNILEYGRMPEPRLAWTSVGGVIEEAFAVVGPSLHAG